MGEKKYRRELMPGDPWDGGATEQWLQDRAAEGWELEELGFRCARFRRTEPRQVRFRCEPVTDRWGHPDREQEALYAETGWEYMGLRNPRYTWYRVWRCADPLAPELRTDAETERYAYRWQLKRSVRRVLWPWLVLIAVLTWLGWTWSRLENPVSSLIGRIGPGQLMTALLIPLCLWDTWRELRCVRYLRRMVTAGIPLPHSGNWRKNQCREHWELAVLAVWWTLLLLYPFWQIGAGNAANQAADREPLPCVTYQTLEPGAGEPVSENVLVNVFLLEPRCYEAWQEYAGDGYVSAKLEVLRFRGLAEALWRERTESFRKAWGAESVRELEDPRFDGVMLVSGENGRQCVSLWRGRLVLTEWTNSGADLTEHLEAFKSVLNRYG